jgi:hypothetical protein
MALRAIPLVERGSTVSVLTSVPAKWARRVRLAHRLPKASFDGFLWPQRNTPRS